MKLPAFMARFFQVPSLTRLRIWLALGIATATDATQFFLGPLGWAFIDEILDVLAMGLTSWLLGFHYLLLPTFVIEFIPVVDMLPTWTACTMAVVALRKRGPAAVPPLPGPPEKPAP